MFKTREILRGAQHPIFYQVLRPFTSPAMVTCALNGILTDPSKFNIPVTPGELAEAAFGAYNEGATAVHVHFRDQREGKGHLPTWDPNVAQEISEAIKLRCPGIIINYTTGTLQEDGPMGGGALGPIKGPVSCLKAGLPDMAALNSGSLNYLKSTQDLNWAWPPIVFYNSVEKNYQYAKGNGIPGHYSRMRMLRHRNRAKY